MRCVNCLRKTVVERTEPGGYLFIKLFNSWAALFRQQVRSKSRWGNWFIKRIYLRDLWYMFPWRLKPLLAAQHMPFFVSNCVSSSSTESSEPAALSTKSRAWLPGWDSMDHSDSLNKSWRAIFRRQIINGIWQLCLAFEVGVEQYIRQQMLNTRLGEMRKSTTKTAVERTGPGRISPHINYLIPDSAFSSAKKSRTKWDNWFI